jgi:hypothetical protein
MSTELPPPTPNPGEFQKGVSGNPAGRPRPGDGSVRDACRSPVFTGAAPAAPHISRFTQWPCFFWCAGLAGIAETRRGNEVAQVVGLPYNFCR